VTKPRRHFVIPDTQVKKGVPIDHMRWVGLAVKDYAPDVVVHLGDHWDSHSMSAYDAPGSAAMEGARIIDDIESGNEALALLTKSMGRYKGRKVLLRGNHEHRMERLVSTTPKLAGVLGYHLYNDVGLGWEVVPYFCSAPGQIRIDGIVYAHYFAAVNTGRAIGGTANNKLNHIGEPFVQGHVQGLDMGSKQFATGKIKQGIVAGSAYLHDEDYKGMANSHWRGVLVLNEVRDGEFCAMPLTLDYLCRKYEGVGLDVYLRRKYRNAAQRFTLARKTA
jgi:hypothetical protein